jgi:peptide/nickel transport system substrate-binding protein
MARRNAVHGGRRGLQLGICRRSATAATTIGSYKDIKVEKIDSHTVKVIFQKPTPFWADPFIGVRGMIIPKHLFEQYKGDKSRDAPANLKPVGTGCYKFVDFRPGDLLTGAANMNYHEPNRPFFDTLEMKGGGDAVSAARAVLQTGNSTTPGTCRWKTRSSSASKPAARGA